MSAKVTIRKNVPEKRIAQRAEALRAAQMQFQVDNAAPLQQAQQAIARYNAQMGSYSAAIGELEALLKDDEEGGDVVSDVANEGSGG